MRTILILTFLFATLGIRAQTQVYSYDAAGNRIHREFYIVQMALFIQNNDTIQDTVYAELREHSEIINETNVAIVDDKQQELVSSSDSNSSGSVVETKSVEIQFGEIKASVFPNPTVNTITVIADESLQSGIISVYNNTGQLLHQQTYNQSNIIQMAHLAKGNYVIKLVSGETQVVWKVIKTD